MVKLTVILIGVLAIHFINGAPNEKVKDLHRSGHHEPKLNDESYSEVENDEGDSKRETQRQKRWYNNFPYTPSYVRPYDQGSELEDNLSYIRLRLQEILDMAKSPPPPPPPPAFYPVYVPIYIPQPQCGCNPTTTEEPTTKAPTIKPTTTTPNETVPNLHERLPEMEDERQNWGILVNNTLSDYDDDDGSRPISLTPIIPGDDDGIPAPPVEHGSKQADINDVETSLLLQQTTTASPVIFEEPSTPAGRPDACDSAIMSCCFGLDRTYKCVQSRGCRDRSIGPNPCNRQTVLSVLSRVQSYYG
ncbi:PREDICTED: uncharacterized protein LOC106120386 [Papilio xuthus]|uniref:Uncharacterized protein LOC106120386 n=1 Tax=Papilio xuthus TaxID=66420 RepID=A0AAJ7EC04_PAPXU|nr:PREDICTED: uncharacterized protein LOC106120386 [Papilio xuthus]